LKYGLFPTKINVLNKYNLQKHVSFWTSLLSESSLKNNDLEVAVGVKSVKKWSIKILWIM